MSTLQCSCHKIIVGSRGPAAIWQNKRTGLFTFLGEHNERPVFQNKATKEYLFFTFTGSEWLVGPDFRKPHAGIQVFGNYDTKCPENFGGKNISQLYIDSSEPSPGKYILHTSKYFPKPRVISILSFIHKITVVIGNANNQISFLRWYRKVDKRYIVIIQMHDRGL